MPTNKVIHLFEQNIYLDFSCCAVFIFCVTWSEFWREPHQLGIIKTTWMCSQFVLIKVCSDILKDMHFFFFNDQLQFIFYWYRSKSVFVQICWNKNKKTPKMLFLPFIVHSNTVFGGILKKSFSNSITSSPNSSKQA